MSKKVFLAICISVLLIGTIVTIGCGKSKEGDLPTLQVGNKWTYETLAGGVYYTISEEVTGEDTFNNKDCWVTKLSMNPPFHGVDSMTSRRDESNLFRIQSEMSGTENGVPFTQVETHSYQFDVPLYPFEVGKTVKVVEIGNRTTTSVGEPQVETNTSTTFFKVERIEEITVPAGKFKCFKIVQYDESGVKLWTGWHSDKVKMFIKDIYEDSDYLRELKSYEL